MKDQYLKSIQIKVKKSRFLDKVKVIPESKNITGKLIYFKNPIFKLNKLLDFPDEFTGSLENITSLKISNPLIESINPKKVLGKTQETIKYNYAGFKNKNFEILEKIEMGFGENGYYYDLHLKFKNVEKNLNIDKILPLLTEMETIQEKIENKLIDYYFLEPKNVKKLEISNFIMNIEFKNSIESLLNPKISQELQNLANSSEAIIPEIKNKANLNFFINFYPKTAEDGLLLNSDEIIIPERVIFFSRDLSRPKKNIYYIRMRGLPAISCLNFLMRIESIVG